MAKASEIYRTGSPAARLERRLGESLTPEFASQLGNGRAVFSTTPNAVQAPATLAQIQAFAQYRREAELVRRLGNDAERNPTHGGVPASLETIFEGWPTGVRVRFRVLGADGEAFAGTFGESVSPDYGSLLSLRTVDPEKRLAPSLDGELSAGEMERVPPSMRDRLLDVRTNDPLAPVGAWLGRCAKARHEDLIAVLGDDLLDARPEAPIEPRRYLASLCARAYSAREAEGMLWIAPLDRTGTRERQADRAALAQWLDVERAGGRLALDDYARFTRRLPLVEDANELLGWLDRLGVADAAWNTPFLRESPPLAPRSHDALDRPAGRRPDET